ncbi:hypothetical protein Cni_G12589 [Canna indica]|uniref:Uncharacterized protein n=1 Tax=Canna indica TaxID=4628 RepID=A0AAQ3QAQ7_9LILI|nr:hypothetical protein Cni_G12589 [Canna indica]
MEALLEGRWLEEAGRGMHAAKDSRHSQHCSSWAKGFETSSCVTIMAFTWAQK